MRKFLSNNEAFTGLEAAIVLTAFIVVAAVFAYVVLGAGFFTTEKAKEVVHTGTDTATSSVELAGNVIAYGNTTDADLKNITIYLQLTAGRNPVDISKGKTVISYTDKNDHISDLYNFTSSSDPNALKGSYSWIIGDNDVILETGEKVRIDLALENSTGIKNPDLTDQPGVNDWFRLEVKPPEGASIAIKRTLPASIDEVMDLQ